MWIQLTIAWLRVGTEALSLLAYASGSTGRKES